MADTTATRGPAAPICGTCLEPILPSDPPPRLAAFWPGCGHTYHFRCLVRLRARLPLPTCAYCRAPWPAQLDPRLSTLARISPLRRLGRGTVWATSPAADAWTADPRAPWWAVACHHLANAAPVTFDQLHSNIAQHPAAGVHAASAALRQAAAGLPPLTAVHFGWACRALAAADGYFTAAAQEVLLQTFGGLAFAATMDRRPNAFRAPPPAAPAAAPAPSLPRSAAAVTRAPVTPLTGPGSHTHPL